MKLICDSREQRPYQFETASEVGTLACGDYSIHGLEDHVAIERKTLDDLIGCLTHDRDRFESELHKGKALDYFALVIEASLSDLADGRYRSNGQRITESLLCKYAREIEKRFKLLNL